MLERFITNSGHAELTKLEGIHYLNMEFQDCWQFTGVKRSLCRVILENESKTKLALSVFDPSKSFFFLVLLE